MESDENDSLLSTICVVIKFANSTTIFSAVHPPYLIQSNEIKKKIIT